MIYRHRHIPHQKFNTIRLLQSQQLLFTCEKIYNSGLHAFLLFFAICNANLGSSALHTWGMEQDEVGGGELKT
jgi:hypothetical protein